MAGKKESKPFRKKRKWIETSSSNSKEQKDKSSRGFTENLGKIGEVDCKQRWYATRLGRV